MPLEQRNFDPAAMAGASVSIQLDLGEILDANNNEILEFDAVGSAVNFVRIANSVASAPAVISAAGDDTNVGLRFAPKGSGTVRFVMSTPVGITSGGAIDFQQLSQGDAHFIIRTTNRTPLTVPGRTSLNTSWLEVRLDTPSGTTRYLQVYD